MLDEFLFADDMAKGAPTEEKMQKGVDQVSDSCDSYDLTISIKKTEVIYQPAPGKPYKEPTISVIGQRLQVVDKFTYLGSTLSRVVHIDDEVNARIAKATTAFGQLRGSIRDRSGIRLDTKLKVYRLVGGWSGGAKVSCILCHRGVQLILAYSWARPAILVVGKGRGGMFLFLLFLPFHSCSSFFPFPLFHLFYYLFFLFSPFLWETTQNDPQGLTCR